MTTRNDPLTTEPRTTERLFYATGMLLDAVDFTDEQLYHRGRLARALAYLHGSGTVTGLAVEYNAGTGGQDELRVQPGLAIDRLGRLVEVYTAACIRLQRWYDQQSDDALRQALHTGANAIPIEVRKNDTELDVAEFEGVVVDLFIHFAACERGKTPAFASGPFDATDAAQPSRVQDGYELQLVLRNQTPVPALPSSPWTGLGSIADPQLRRRRIQETLLGHWPESSIWTGDDRLKPLSIPDLAGLDPTSVFLARVVLPVQVVAPPARLLRVAGEAHLDNHSRPFAYPTGALAAGLGW